MKRKLDENDVPKPVEAQPNIESTAAVTFESFGLDSRILQGVAKAGYEKPTAVQSHAIPPALQGKDVVARAYTGSGKTGAYLLPVLQSVLHQRQAKPNLRATLALVLVPTKELARQVCDFVILLASHCSKQIRVLNLSQKAGDTVVRAQLEESPEILVGTPARVMAHVQSGALSLDGLLNLVVDEADLILSYGHEEDLKNLSGVIPQPVQKTLMSATVSTELDSLEKLFCNDPVTIEVEETKEEAERMLQFIVKCGEAEKFLLLYAIFKLDLVKGKCLVFVHDIDRCYRLKLYLEQFGVRSCVLNSELPVNTRIHTVEEFNKNAYKILIAADENEVLGNESRRKRNDDAENDDADANANVDADTAEANHSKPKTEKKSQSKSKHDREYGVSRGIDFKHVALVLNFDLPTTAKSYTHRIGRTARAGQSGTAVSFVIPKAEFHKHKPTSLPSTAEDETVLAAIEASQASRGRTLRPWSFTDEVRAFEYRVNDAMRAVTRVAVRQARTKELRQELLNSEKLQRHFKENPDELNHLRHDGELRAARVQPHLKHVPEYLMPKAAAAGEGGKQDIGYVGLGRISENGIRKMHRDNKGKKRGSRKVVRDRAGRKDPLRTFNARGKGKK